MKSESPFARVPEHLESVLKELRLLEPIFHRRAFGTTIEDIERRTAPDYWEVGASGSRYSRAFILQTLAENPPVDAEAEGWDCSDFGIRQLGTGTYLLTYTLDQKGRITRRATIWKRHGEEWRILYHQGTVGEAENGDNPQ